jgi:DNA-binding CsgD family transcriptional regulator
MDATYGTLRCPILIGRDDLLELADRRLEDVETGRGQFLLVGGVAGIGKSRLLRAIGHKAAERGFRSSYGHLAPQDTDLPGASIRDFARTMAFTPELAEIGPRLLHALDQAPDVSLTGRRRLALDLVDMILEVPDAPVLYGFEDLQWADDLSLDTISELARRSRDRSIMLLAGYRTDEARPGSSLRDWRSRLVTQRIAEEIRLGPLSASETALVTTLILDSGLPAPRDVASAVYARTDGIPLHIEELLGALGADARANGRAIREAIVPDTIEDAVISRLSHRSTEAQAAARAGAVIGRCFTADVLAGIMDVPTEALDAPLQELCDNFLLWPPGDDGYFDFPHQLLREAIYRSVKVGERRRYHARAGEFGARLIGQSEIHASAHFERAGMRREAHRSALAAARDVARISLHREAFDLYRRAVDNMPDDLGPGERAEILHAYAGEALAIDEYEVGEQVAILAAAAYRAAGDPIAAMGAAEHAQNVWRRQGRPVDERCAGLRALLAELDTLGDLPGAGDRRMDLRFSLAINLIDGRQIDEGLALLGEVREYAERRGDTEFVLAVDWKMGVAEMIAGETESGLQRTTTAALAAEQAGWEAVGVSAFRDASTFAADFLDYPASKRWTEAGLRYADSIQQSFCAHMMASTSAMIAWAGADWTQADTLARESIADHAGPRATEIARWTIGYVAMGRGDTVRARDALEEALAFGITSQEVGLILPPAWGLAELALLAGEPGAALARCRDALARALAVGERVHLTPFVVTGVRAAQAAGRPAEAATWLAACRDQIESIPDVAGAALDHGQGLVALADGATGVARRALEVAIEGWDRHGRAWEGTWARLDLAACHVRSNRFADALALATEVQALATRLDCPAMADRADTLARMARGHVSEDEPWRPLTAREYAVARLVSEGMTNAEIADALGIAPKTASAHIEHILAKLGASRRAEIATWTSSVAQTSLVS